MSWVVNIKTRRLYPRKKKPDTHWIGSWVGPEVDLDILKKRKIYFPLPDFEPRTSEPVFQSPY